MCQLFPVLRSLLKKLLQVPKPAHFGADVDWNEEKRRWTLPSKVENLGEDTGMPLSDKDELNKPVNISGGSSGQTTRLMDSSRKWNSDQ